MRDLANTLRSVGLGSYVDEFEALGLDEYWPDPSQEASAATRTSMTSD